MKRTERGFTLVEVVVAVLLMGILFTGMATMPRNIMMMRAAYSARTAASHLAEIQLEIRRNTDFDRIAAQTATGVAQNGITYTVTVFVADKSVGAYTGSAATPQLIGTILAAPSGPADCKLVTVLVQWQANGINQSLRRQAFIGRYE